MRSKYRVSNNKGWKRRTDEWVQRSHESRKRKEREQRARQRRKQEP